MFLKMSNYSFTIDKQVLQIITYKFKICKRWTKLENLEYVFLFINLPDWRNLFNVYNRKSNFL